MGTSIIHRFISSILPCFFSQDHLTLLPSISNSQSPFTQLSPLNNHAFFTRSLSQCFQPEAVQQTAEDDVFSGVFMWSR